MPTFIDGSQNLAALTVPGVYLDIIPPQPIVGGAPTNLAGVVGVGSWGPVNSPVPFSTPDECAGAFGYPAVRTFDLPTYIYAASQTGSAASYYGVRVTDGTDAAASAIIQTNGITITAKYTGTRGNGIQWAIQTGSKPNSYCIVISFPGRAPERFDNITGAANAFWVAAANAINNGTSVRAKSAYVVATAGASTTAPTVATGSLSGGTDGASGVAVADLVGSDTSPRTGMYALRSTGIDLVTLCDVTDSTTWATQDAFALSENAEAVFAMASGGTIADATAERVTKGIDSSWSKILVGDYPTFYDSYNGYARLVNPSAFAIGLMGNLSPQLSPLNKQLRGVVATQATTANTAYSQAELSAANTGGVDLIIGPPSTPGGAYFSFATGRNSSSNSMAAGDEWTRMTNFIARSLNSYAAGSIVGKLQSTRPDDPTRMKAKMLLDSFFTGLKSPSTGSGGYGMIDDFAVTCDLTNNPAELQARGFLFAYAAVRYLNTVRYFVIKLAGGGNVDVSSQATQPTAAQFM